MELLGFPGSQDSNLLFVINLIKQNSYKSIMAWLINKSLINYYLQSV